MAEKIVPRRESRELSRGRSFDPVEAFRELMRWDPFRELGIGGAVPPQLQQFTPQFDVKETNDAYVFTADMPGMKEEDVDVSITGHRLTITGERNEEKKEGDERYHMVERSYGSFTRSFTLPEGTDPENVDGQLKDGVLQIRVPKKPEVQARKLSLKGKGAQAKA